MVPAGPEDGLAVAGAEAPYAESGRGAEDGGELAAGGDDYVGVEVREVVEEVV